MGVSVQEVPAEIEVDVRGVGELVAESRGASDDVEAAADGAEDQEDFPGQGEVGRRRQRHQGELGLGEKGRRADGHLEPKFRSVTFCSRGSSTRRRNRSSEVARARSDDVEKHQYSFSETSKFGSIGSESQLAEPQWTCTAPAAPSFTTIDSNKPHLSLAFRTLGTDNPILSHTQQLDLLDSQPAIPCKTFVSRSARTRRQMNALQRSRNPVQVLSFRIVPAMNARGLLLPDCEGRRRKARVEASCEVRTGS